MDEKAVNLKIFADLAKEKLDEMGISKNKLSRETGVGRDAITGLMRGSKNTNIETAYKVAIYLNIKRCSKRVDGFQQKIRDKMKESGTSMYKLGLASGVMPHNIKRFLDNEISISLNSAMLIADCLGFQVFWGAVK